MSHRYTVKVDDYGNVLYTRDGEWHRDGGKPAWVGATGYISYWRNGYNYSPPVKK